MKIIALLTLLLSATLHAQRMTAFPAITGSAVDPANDLLWLNDTSQGNTSAASRKITLAELVNVSSFTNGNFLAANAVEQAQVNGLVTDLAAKAPLANPTFTGTVNGITKSMVGLGNVDNTSDVNKPVSAAAAAALARSLRGKVIYIADYSPDITGATSSSQAIQNAINALPAEGGAVVAPSGATLLCKDIRLPSNCHFIGYGCTFKIGGTSPSGAAIDPENAVLGSMIYAFGSPGALIKNVRVSGGRYQGSRTDWVGISGEDFLSVTWCDGVVLRDFILEDVGQDGMEIKSCLNVVIEDSDFYRIRDAAIELRGCLVSRVKNNRFYTVANAVFCKSNESAYTGSYQSEVMEISGNYAEYFGGESGVGAFGLSWPNKLVLTHNVAVGVVAGAYNGANFTAIGIGAHPVHPPPSVMRDITVSDNRVYGLSTNYGIQVQAPPGIACENVVISNNHLRGGGQNLFFRGSGTVSGNDCDGSSGLCAYIVTQLGPISLVSNFFRDAGGVELAGDSAMTYTDNVTGGVLQVNINNAVISNNRLGSLFFGASNTGGLVTGNSLSPTSQTGISATANDFLIKGNFINSTASGSSAIQIAGARNVIDANHITAASTSVAVLNLLSTTDNCTVSNNVIQYVGSTAGIAVNGDYTTVIGNKVRGGNQGIRVYSTATHASLIGNFCRDYNFQGIDIQSGATKTMVIGNTTLVLADAGTSTISANNRTD